MDGGKEVAVSKPVKKHENIWEALDVKKDEPDPVIETKPKRRFKGKRCRPRKKSNANADQVKKFEEKINGCDK